MHYQREEFDIHECVRIGDETYCVLIENDSRLGCLYEWVAKQHEGQLRKDGAPYIDHLHEVAAIASEFCPDEEYVVEVAILHGLLEDTDVTVDQLLSKLIGFGYQKGDAVEIWGSVAYLTCEKSDLPRNTRKKDYANRLAYADGLTQSIKCADIVSNFRDTSSLDKKFLNKYCAEKLYLLPLLDKAEPRLHALATRLVKKANYCDKSCGPSDFCEGGKCDKNGCYH
jgi:(p)ppGpp synthase/HD superfamily hydrolase